MNVLFSDIYWKNGRPKGRGSSTEAGTGYKIVADPYFKQISVEQYENYLFTHTVYDSALLDFRKLREEIHPSWQTAQAQGDGREVIRNHDDRVVLVQEFAFIDELCRSCKFYSPHGAFLGSHQLYYTHQGDAFNGVILFDSEARPVMKKTYTFEDGIFTQLQDESWEVKSIVN